MTKAKKNASLQNDRKRKALFVVDALKKRYKQAVCSLEYEKPHQLLFSVRLAAQCTDARVNTVTPELFRRYPTLEDIADADVFEIEKIILPCGLYKTKARDIKASAKMLIDCFGGALPGTMEELLQLPGVGRKTANLILGDIFGQSAVVTDTHCIRICWRIGLCDSKEPFKVEMQLKEILPPEESNDFCHRLVFFGREICTARNPKCEKCELKSICDFQANKKII